jgi:HEAT repeat protein
LDPGVPSPPPHAESEAYFTITIDEYGTADLPAVFEPFVRDLQSSDLKQKLEAAEVIADLAPPFLERTLLEMLNSTPDLRHYGVQGLRTLATPNAHQTLAEFVKNAPPTDSFGPYQEAIRALGEIGNAGDVDLLLAVAKANTPVGPSRALAIEAAGEAGGDSAVGPLATDLSQEWGEARVAVARGLSLTGSRSAVPTLIDLLRTPQKEVREAAEFGLHALTRHDAGSTGAPASPGGAYDAWNQWWHNHAATARIFKPKSYAAAPAP